MVESVDKRDERNERPGGAAEQCPARDVTTTRTGEPFTDMSEKQTVSTAVETAGDSVAPAGETTDAREMPEADATASPVVTESATPVEPQPMAGARVIPFVPRNGVVRAAPLPQQVELRFSRPVAGPAAYGSAAEPGGPFSPAQPPPPTGFRRSLGMGAALPEMPAGASGVRKIGSSGSGEGIAGARLKDFLDRVRAGWSWRRAIKYVVLGFAALIVAYVALVVAMAVAYRWVNPPTSTLMMSQRLSGTEIAQVWTPIDRISPNLMQAVILSEDGQFCRHRGVDWLAMKEAIEQSLDGNARGGSTISMQTVKNLFLWPSKSYVRKAIELPLAMGTEMIWSKQRMLELYLNIAEWGPGIFGAEAASRHYFGKSAAHLTAREASLLAVALPNPIERQAGSPSLGHQRLAERLQARMRRVPNAAACALPGRSNRAALADPTGQGQVLPL